MKFQFTKENAAAMAAKSAEAKRQRKLQRIIAEKTAASAPVTADEMRRGETLMQIDSLDKDFRNAKTPELRLKLVAAKSKLWQLVFPSPGALKPQRPHVHAGGIGSIQSGKLPILSGQ